MTANKVAVITGASQGIGREVARGLAEDGYDVVLIARSEDKLNDLANEIKQYSVKSKIISCDISQFDILTDEINQVINEWGRIDVLVNNAGIFREGSLETSFEDYLALFHVNFKAPLLLLKLIAPVMQKQQCGYIFNIASIAGKFGYSQKGAYASTKFALVGLSESLHSEYSSQGIKVTSICPGWVNTEMAKASPIPEADRIQPSDILQSIRWVLSLSKGAFVKEIILNNPE